MLPLGNSAASLWAHSLICLRTIFPLASLGTALMKTTPPVSRLCFDTLEAIQSSISLGETSSWEDSWITMYARGRSSSSLFLVHEDVLVFYDSG